ncbi:MAG TPA: TetR/AcrR family transcriptional regulator [Xanthobacteraceae bacterium]
MAQIKKAEVRQAILDAAYKLFSQKGYSATNISNIARAANVAPANVYVYFRSKLEVLFCVYEPWLTAQIEDLERSLKGIRDPRQRLRKIIKTFWRDIPSAENGFANNMMQAIATTDRREGYSPNLRLGVEEQAARLLERCIPGLGRDNCRELANIIMMAFDGYTLNFHLKGGAICPQKQVALFSEILLNARLEAKRPGNRGRSTKAGFSARANGKATIAR